MQQQLTQALEAYLQKLDDEARIEAINAFRQVLHHYSPFRSQPVDCVLWVKQERVAPNDYNPNNVAPPEKRLLQTSLEADGFTQLDRRHPARPTGVYDCRWFSPP